MPARRCCVTLCVAVAVQALPQRRATTSPCLLLGRSCRPTPDLPPLPLPPPPAAAVHHQVLQVVHPAAGAVGHAARGHRVRALPHRRVTGGQASADWAVPVIMQSAARSGCVLLLTSSSHGIAVVCVRGSGMTAMLDGSHAARCSQPSWLLSFFIAHLCILLLSSLCRVTASSRLSSPALWVSSWAWAWACSSSTRESTQMAGRL